MQSTKAGSFEGEGFGLGMTVPTRTAQLQAPEFESIHMSGWQIALEFSVLL